MTVNYEAVGRYVTAEEKVQDLVDQQGKLIEKIEAALVSSRSNYYSTRTVRK